MQRRERDRDRDRDLSGRRVGSSCEATDRRRMWCASRLMVRSFGAYREGGVVNCYPPLMNHPPAVGSIVAVNQCIWTSGGLKTPRGGSLRGRGSGFGGRGLISAVKQYITMPPTPLILNPASLPPPGAVGSIFAVNQCMWTSGGLKTPRRVH